MYIPHKLSAFFSHSSNLAQKNEPLEEISSSFIKKNLKLFIKVNLIQYITYLVLPLVSILGILGPRNAVHAASTTKTPYQDVYISPSTAYGNRAFLLAGKYTDCTVGCPITWESRAFMKFDMTLPPGAIVTSATLRVYHYATSSGGAGADFKVSKATGSWDENTDGVNDPYVSDDNQEWGTAYIPGNWTGNPVARDFALSATLINDLRSNNTGIVIKPRNNKNDPGFAFCSRDYGMGHPVCNDPNLAPQLIINYIVNQVPNQPNLDRPQSGWELGPKTNGSFTGVTCSTTGTGSGCVVEFRANAEDPDNTFPLTNTYQIRSTQGGNQDQSNTGEGWQIWTKTLNDGNWSWRGKSVDTYGGDSGWTADRTFIVDTTAPTVPIITTEPAFTARLQNTIDSSISTDNIIGGVQYEFERAQDNLFSIDVNSSGWIDTNSFTFSSLVDNTTYYYRVRSRDSLWNISNWSNYTNSTQDATLPILDSLNISETRISPINIDGDRDSSTITVQYSDLHLESILIEIINSSTSEVINTYSENGLTATSNTTNYIWNGKDNSNSYVVDGTYNINITITDKAGNFVTNNSLYIIVDNTIADISVSTPADGSYFNADQVTINGQTEADAVLNIFNYQLSILNSVILDGLGLFSRTEPLSPGLNMFDLTSTDNTGNTNTETYIYYKENLNPTIGITPNTLINDQTPLISLNLTDTGEGAYISGIDSSSLFLSITHPDTGELVLVNNGINVQPTLGNIVENCSGVTGTYGLSGPESCIYSFQFTSALQPDGNYKIKAEVSDKAGNVTLNEDEGFELDSHIQNDINTPTNGQLFNYSKINLSGTAEKDANLNISIPDIDVTLGADSESFTINPSSSSGRITVSNCRYSSNPSQDGIKEICDWNITDFQLEKDPINPGVITNNITFLLTDTAGNIDSKVTTVDVNLYAVNLTISTDLNFFSPNGDGRQDGVEFNNITSDGIVDLWEIRIDDSTSNRVRTFNGFSSLPINLPWDGRDDIGDFVSDGTYTYYLWIRTTDGVEFTTSPQSLTAATSLVNQVIITFPKNDSYSTRGVTNVQGQAPAGSKVRICDDVIGITGICEFEYYSDVDSYGSFSMIIPLYRLEGQNITEHYLTASASDKYGNNTPDSNSVKITVTNKTPFERIEIIPAYTGVNNELDYQIIIDKLNNNELITQADIDSLRSVVFRSTVNQGTERVKLSFSDLTNLNELPDPVAYQNIGWVDGNNSTHLYQNFSDGVTPYTQCNSTTCTWDFYYPVPPVNGGLYEIAFEGKLDVEIQTLTAPLTIDGNIPLAPMILDIDKIISGSNQNTNLVDNIYYSNSEIIQIKGVSDANAAIEVRDQNNNLLCSTVASGIGFWTCNADVSTFYPSINTQEISLSLHTYATLGLNTSESITNPSVYIDKINPEFVDILTTSQWHQSGDIIDLDILADEVMSYSKNTESSTLGCINDSISGGTITDLNISSDRQEAIGSFIIPGFALEGRYCSTVEIQDLAGNRNTSQLTFYIDNTAPDIPNIDTSTWGIYNGVYTQPGFVSLGRLNPEYVHEEPNVNIIGLAEESQLVELYVNGVKKSETYAADLSSGLCVTNGSDIIVDNVLVKSGYNCLYVFSFPFDQGEVGYSFQVKTTDYSGNKSIISEDELVYYDKTPPLTPQTVETRANDKPIVDWIYAKDQKVTAANLGTGNFGKIPITNQKSIYIEDWAESLSDIVYVSYDPAGNILENSLSQKSGNGLNTRNVNLSGGDGIYTFISQSTDAPGNTSPQHLFQIELDTIPPQTPKVSLGFDTNYKPSAIYMYISGEPGSFGTIGGGQLSQNGNTVVLVKSLSIWNDTDWERTFTFCTKLHDRATNESGSACASIKTPVRPDRPGECEASLNRYINDYSFSEGDGGWSMAMAKYANSNGQDKNSENKLYLSSYNSCISNSCDEQTKIDYSNKIIDRLDSKSCKEYARDALTSVLVSNLDINHDKYLVQECVSTKSQERDANGNYKYNETQLYIECDKNGVVSQTDKEATVKGISTNRSFEQCLSQGIIDKCGENGDCSYTNDPIEIINNCESSNNITDENRSYDKNKIEDTMSQTIKEYRSQLGRGNTEDCKWQWDFWNSGSCVSEGFKEGVHYASEGFGAGLATILSISNPIAWSAYAAGFAYDALNGNEFGTSPIKIFNYMQDGAANGFETVINGVVSFGKSAIDLIFQAATAIDAVIFTTIDSIQGHEGPGFSGYYEELKDDIVGDTMKWDMGSLGDDLLNVSVGIVVIAGTVVTGGMLAGALGVGGAITAGTTAAIITNAIAYSTAALLIGNIAGLVTKGISLQTGLGQIDQFDSYCEDTTNQAVNPDKYNNLCTDGKFDYGKFRKNEVRNMSMRDVAGVVCGNENIDLTKDPFQAAECVGYQGGMWTVGFGTSLTIEYLRAKLGGESLTPDSSYQYDLLKKQLALQEQMGMDAYKAKFGKLYGTDLINGIEKAFIDLPDGVKFSHGFSLNNIYIDGEWIKVSESMSENSRSYQEFVTGHTADESFLKNGVKFDGVKDGKLIDAKGSYKQFVNSEGKFYDWFMGKNDLVDQANRQTNAAKGVPIEWYFQDETSFNGVKNLFGSQYPQLTLIVKTN